MPVLGRLGGAVNWGQAMDAGDRTDYQRDDVAGQTDPTEALLGAVQQRLAASARVTVQRQGARLVVARRRVFGPRRGVFRMLLPHMRTVVQARKNGGLRCTVRPDGMAIFMAVVLVGGVVVELTMDRATYPREYPPVFTYGLAAGYLLGLGAEWRYTRRLVRGLLGLT